MSEKKNMGYTASPLRYPGGKTKLYPLISPIIDKNIKKGIYIEPFAGGAGLALQLLFNGHVSSIVLNDFDYSIYCLWKSCIEYSDELCELINSCKINIPTWQEQKNIYQFYSNKTILEIGFATLFLNRCNVSGVITGGPIGGKNQTGKYLLDARFNKNNLIQKIQKIKSYRYAVELYNKDAVDFLQSDIKKYSLKKTLLNIDPPYVKKGKMLYKNFFTDTHHIFLSNVIKELKHKWIITYDTCEFIEKLYSEYTINQINLKYSAGQTKQGKELIIFSNNLIVK